jgi:hypothetical protein
MKRFVLILLVALVAAGCGGAASSGDGTSGVFGQVLLGPQCPVEQEGSPCPDQPTEAEVRVMTVDGTDVIASERTDAEGRFRISVEPGTYTIQAFPLEGETIVFGKPQNLTVPEGEFVEANVSLDTGIR